jgi:chorismate mutase
LSKPATTKSAVPEELLQFRERIDNIDEEILAALARRFEVTVRVGELKAQHGLESVDPVREQEKLQRLRALAEQKGLDGKLVHDLFQRVFNEVVKNHRQLLAAAQESRK